MARKKKIEENNTYKRPTLSAEQYYRWRLSIEELWHAEKKVQINELRLKLMEKGAELEVAKAALGRATNLQQANQAVAESKQRYNDLKRELETALGVSLDNKAIDEITFEIKEIPRDG